MLLTSHSTESMLYRPFAPDFVPIEINSKVTDFKGLGQRFPQRTKNLTRSQETGVGQADKSPESCKKCILVGTKAPTKMLLHRKSEACRNELESFLGVIGKEGW